MRIVLQERGQECQSQGKEIERGYTTGFDDE